MSSERQKPELSAEATEKSYHKPTLQEHGSARDLTRSNPGVGPDGAFFDGADAGLDGAGTAS